MYSAKYLRHLPTCPFWSPFAAQIASQQQAVLFGDRLLDRIEIPASVYGLVTLCDCLPPLAQMQNAEYKGVKMISFSTIPVRPDQASAYSDIDTCRTLALVNQVCKSCELAREQQPYRSFKPDPAGTDMAVYPLAALAQTVSVIICCILCSIGRGPDTML